MTPANSVVAATRSRSRMVSVMSTVSHSVTCGAVNALATIAAAVCLRTPLIGMRRSRDVSPVGAAGAGQRRLPALGPRRGPCCRLDVGPGDHAAGAGPVTCPGRRRGRAPACVPAAWPARDAVPVRGPRRRGLSSGRLRRRLGRHRLAPPPRPSRPDRLDRRRLGLRGRDRPGGAPCGAGAWPLRTAARSRPGPPYGRRVSASRSARLDRPLVGQRRHQVLRVAWRRRHAGHTLGLTSTVRIGVPTSTVPPSGPAAR